MPRKRLHSFVRHNLKDSARIDFYRGKPQHDLTNWLWSQWFHRSPGYRGRLAKFGLGQEAEGNAMEWLAGVAFAAATDCKYLPPDVGT